MPEVAVYLPDILTILGWSKSKFWRRYKTLHNAGVIFYRNQGSPPHKRLCAFPSTLHRWIALKAMRGEVI